MPSSPADPGNPAPADVLRALAAAYDDALRALAGGDLEGCAAALTRTDALLLEAARHESTSGPVTATLLAEAKASHARLLSVVTGMHADAGEELARARQGRRALEGYGRTHAKADRVRSDA